MKSNCRWLLLLGDLYVCSELFREDFGGLADEIVSLFCSGETLVQVLVIVVDIVGVLFPGIFLSSEELVHFN